MSEKDPSIDQRLEDELREAESLHDRIPKDAPSFTATVMDPTGLDALPCSLFGRLNYLYFPDCLVGVSTPENGDKAVMQQIFSLMMLAVGYGTTVEFRCDTDPKTFEILRRCLCLLFRRADKPSYGETYDECTQILQDCNGKGPEHLLEELSKVARLEGRSPLLGCHAIASFA